MSLFRKSNTRKSNEEKLFDMLDAFGTRSQLNEVLFHDYSWNYEQLRHTWKDSKTTIKSYNLIYKVKKGDCISDSDIADVKAKAKTNGIPESDAVLKFYIGVLETMKKLGEDILKQVGPNEAEFTNIAGLSKKNIEKDMPENANKLIEISRKVEEAVKLQQDIPPTIKYDVQKLKDNFEHYIAYLKSVEKLIYNKSNGEVTKDYRIKFSKNSGILKAAEELTNYFYGNDNVIKKGAKKFFNDNKEFFDLLLKCDEKRYKKMLEKKSNNTEHELILGFLEGVLTEIFGNPKNRYGLRIQDIKKCYGC